MRVFFMAPHTSSKDTIPPSEFVSLMKAWFGKAATKENDPFLRGALWDEYNQYKKIARD